MFCVCYFKTVQLDVFAVRQGDFSLAHWQLHFPLFVKDIDKEREHVREHVRRSC